MNTTLLRITIALEWLDDKIAQGGASEDLLALRERTYQKVRKLWEREEEEDESREWIAEGIGPE